MKIGYNLMVFSNGNVAKGTSPIKKRGYLHKLSKVFYQNKH